MAALPFASIARLPHAGDNVAIALRRLEAGETIQIGGREHVLQHTVLEGHRFAAQPIAAGEAVRSWSMPFGYALREIAAAEYVTNDQTLEILSKRDLAGAKLPHRGNFENRIRPYALDEAAFRAAEQVPLASDAATKTFRGFPRGGGRGTGTRNAVVVLGTSSRTAAIARAWSAKVPGTVPVAHTEGGGATAPHNRLEVLRTLAGFMVNPNVGAVLAVDEGEEPINNRVLQDFIAGQGYPIAEVRHRFFSLRAGTQVESEALSLLRSWIAEVATEQRIPCPLSELRIGLQCGGSDAFSGISANPLVGRVGREVVRYGGAVNLAETDELVGAESYVLAKVKDLSVARRLLEMIARFKERLGWHGVTVEGNPSGGNRLRGLYNINLKSLGAAMKKDPEVRLDHAIEYAEPMRAPGFYFMNSPGNDLESVAGQAGAGCNLIFFTTGNGSVTNFPFIPTLKVTSTSRRHRLLENEMDVNAGKYLDGTAMDELAEAMFALVQRVASGELTKGERAGHSQVSLWREWRQTSSDRLGELKARPAPSGRPIPLAKRYASAESSGSIAQGGGQSVVTSLGAARAGRRVGRRVGLIIPTSMCSSQIARMAAERLNQAGGEVDFVALPHTEGCGFAGDTLYATLRRTYRGYATHPAVRQALFLEHGCEKIPNDAVRLELQTNGIDPANFGWASVQLDGGIESVLTKIQSWAAAPNSQRATNPRNAPNPHPGETPAPGRSEKSAILTERRLDSAESTESDAATPGITVALITEGVVEATTESAFGTAANAIVTSGGTILVAQSDPLLRSAAFRNAAGLPTDSAPTLAYGEAVKHAGFHQVDTESTQWQENLTGLGACGAEVFLAYSTSPAKPGHPFIPVVHFTTPPTVNSLLQSLSAERNQAALTDFQFTRGELGVST